jgi:AcrR family transcriptional regulator
MKKSANRPPLDTRGRILNAAYDAFYRNGYQSTGINDIIKKADTTKGGLFHYFDDKLALGYAVVDEIIEPGMKQSWLEPLAASVDPIADIKRLFRKSIKGEIEGVCVTQGCPLNNFAQEMSLLDEGFRKRIEAVYKKWRGSLEAAFTRGIKMGKVKKDVSPQSVAIFIIAVQMGAIGTAKNSQSPELMTEGCEVLFSYLDTLVP